MNITNIVIYLIVAAVIGWLASEIMRDRASLLINILVAILGAFLAGYFLSPIFGIGTINDAINVPTMLVTLLGAIIVIAIVHLVRRRI
ncbi:MAG: GlsB/YeaQ/YmgE family stress response membrane protein [Anaerolineales bacterium]|nr:GlsB/YeaQ/YmgE family stress response membrane protein [Anaerolineales bacterium]